MQTELTDPQWERYARHIVLDEVGEDGQLKLINAKVLVVGAGGLGSPMIQYLAAAGVGRIGIIDHDTVDVSNLQRQTIHRFEDVGRPKAGSAAGFVRRLDPELRCITRVEKLTEDNVGMVADYDIVADGTDNFRTRFLLNDACVRFNRTLVSSALLRFDGQISVFKPHAGEAFPCYRCIFPDEPPADLIPRCQTAGIFGAVAGVMGTLQATEVIKEILGLGDTLAGRLMLYDGLSSTIRTIKVKRRAGCASCGHP